MKNISRILSIISLVVPWTNANAMPMKAEIHFSVSGSQIGFPVDPPQATISGSFSFHYDDEIFIGGIENFQFNPSNVSLSIAGTNYTINNTGVLARFTDGNLSDVLIGGNLNNVHVLNSGTNDFIFSNSVGGILFEGELTYSTASDPRIFKTEKGSMSYTITRIPEPATILLFSIGILSIRIAKEANRTANS